MNFKFSKADLENALKANGWSEGWGAKSLPGGDWVPPFGNADRDSMSFRKAVESLFYNKNLVPSDMKRFWEN